MTSESLQRIIALEEELHAEERAEEVRAGQWRNEQEAILRAETERQLQALAAQRDAAHGSARERAEQEAARIVSAARQHAGRLAAVSDDSLRRLLARHLPALIAGRIP